MSKFCLTVNYDKSSPDPEHIFLGMGKFLEALKALDNDAIHCIDNELSPSLLLEDVQNGSIKLWLRNFISSIPDEGISDLDINKIIGGYLVKAKYIALKFLSDRDTFNNVDEVRELETAIANAAAETNANTLGCYSAPARRDLLEHLSMIGNALSVFRETEQIYIHTTDEDRILINSNFRLPRERIDEFCQGENIENISTVLLKIRKIDFLGNSKWSFRYGGKAVEAKMSDGKWFEDFKQRKFAVYPGDALRVKLRTTATYGRNSELISEQHEIIEVLSIVPDSNAEQTELPLQTNTDQ